MAFTKALFGVLLLQYALAADDPTTTPVPIACVGQDYTPADNAAHELLQGSVAANSTCRFSLFVADDSYLKADISIKNAQVGDLITIFNIIRYNDIVVGNGRNDASVVYPKGSKAWIDIQTGKTTNPEISITITAIKVPTDFPNPGDKTTQVGNQAFKIKLSELKVKPYHITSVPKPAVADPPAAEKESGNIVLTTLAVGSGDKTSWMNVFLFDSNKKFLMTLADVVNTMDGRYADQKELFVFNANPDAADSTNLISINNVENLAMYKGATELFIPMNTTFTSYELDATTNSPAVVTVFTNSDQAVLTNVTFTDINAALELVAGEPVPDETAYLLATYKPAVVANQLPQALFATSVTFRLDKGKATLKFMPNASAIESGWQLMRHGRTGFLSTQNYRLAEAGGYSHLNLLSDDNGTLYDIIIGEPKGNTAATCRYTGLGENNNPIGAPRGLCKATNFTGTFLTMSLSPGEAAGGDLGAFLPFKIQEAIPQHVTPGPGETEGTTPRLEPIGQLDCQGQKIQSGVDLRQYRFAGSSNCFIQFDFTKTTAMRITLKVQGIAGGEKFQLQYGEDSKQIIRPGADGTLQTDITWSSSDGVFLSILTSDKTENIFWLQTSNISIDLAAQPTSTRPLKAGAAGLVALDQVNDLLPGRSYAFTSDTGVTLSAAFDPDDTLAAQAASLFLYEGDGANKVLKGSLLSLLSSKTYTSTKTLTIYMAHPVNMTSPTQIFANDKANLNRFASYAVQWPPQVNFLSITLDATKGATALTFADTKDNHRNFVLDNIKFSNNNQTLLVSAGAPTTESKQLYSFSSKDSTVYSDDMAFPGYTKTLSLDRGTAVVDLVFEGNPLVWSTATKDDRRGAIMTPNYPSGASNGDYIVEFLNDENKLYKYNFTVETSDADSKMSVSFWDGEKWGAETSVDVKSDYWEGKKGMKLRLNGGNKENSSGIYMTFHMVKSAAAIVPTIVIFFMALYA